MLSPAERHEIERLRKHRVRRGREAPLAAPIDDLASHLKKQRRKVGGAASAWSAVLPRALAEQTQIVSLRAGLLTVRVADSAMRFRIHGLLRMGGRRALEQASDGAISRVRLVL